ncbi:MAG TPA: peptidoglycan-binding protein [Acidimicrobiales bacterium]
MTDEALPFRTGDSGAAVRDLQERLAACGHPACTTDIDGGDPSATFGPTTDAAVRAFQTERRIVVDGVVGRQTWSALVEASYRLGDRLLYRAKPMLRGDDVAELQRRLGGLGFDAGRVDGIFGPDTTAAAEDFQRNVGIVADAIVGPDTIAAIARLGERSSTNDPIGPLHETERLRAAPKGLSGFRVVVSDRGGAAALADAVGRRLTTGGAEVVVVHDPDDSRVARQANTFDAGAVVGLSIGSRVATAYYGRTGSESVGGRRLATAIDAELSMVLGCIPTPPTPMTLPLLRETRAPAVIADVGPPSAVVVSVPRLAESCATAVTSWVADPA